ncbi:MAG: carboxymuconolactone decarboxylase family protein [Rhodobacteraceae bacterium]|nr:carboxymuconolactone decarboxylase family protein [Paracoccaceae bacterium]
MTDTKNPWAAMLSQVNEVAKAFPVMNAFDPKALEAMMPVMPKDLMEAFFGNTINENGLDAKTRLLITLSGLTMQGALNPTMVRQTVRHAIEAGATEQQVIETIGMMSMFAGIPAMTRTMELAKEVLDNSGEDG